MTTRVFLQSTTNPKLRMEMLSRDPVTGKAKLKGVTSEFEDIVTKETLARYKYKIVKETDDEN